MKMFATRRANNISGLEDLLNPSYTTIPMTLRYYHPNFSHALPSEILLDLLPSETLLRLRVVSHTTAFWANQALPEIFNTIHVGGHRAHQSIESQRALRALQRVGAHCQHLIVRLERSIIITPLQPTLQEEETSNLPTPIPKHQRSASSSSAFSAARGGGGGGGGGGGSGKHLNRFPWPKHSPFRNRSGSGSIQGLRSPPAPTSAPRHAIPSSPLSPLASIPRFRSNHTQQPTNTTFAVPPFKRILANLPSLVTLTISIPQRNLPPWATGLGSLEAQLIALRVALEESSLSHFTTLCLRPIHLMGILHVRWAGGGSWREAGWMAGRTWMRVRVLEVCLLSPVGGGGGGGRKNDDGDGDGEGDGAADSRTTLSSLTRDQSRMFVKVLHDYLGSFRLRLEVLKFWWVGEGGEERDGRNPNPLLLDLDEGGGAGGGGGGGKGRKGFSAPAIRWKALRECWLGNVEVDAEALAVIWQRAPRLRAVRVMDEYWRGETNGAGELVLVDGVWWREFWGEEVLIQPLGHDSQQEDPIDDELHVGDSAGLSDDDRFWEDGWDDVVSEGNYGCDDDALSQTSMVVPFMLQR